MESGSSGLLSSIKKEVARGNKRGISCLAPSRALPKPLKMKCLHATSLAACRNLRRQLIKVRQPILDDGLGRRAANLPGLLLGRVRHLLPSLELILEFGRVEKGAALRWRRGRWSAAAAACHKGHSSQRLGVRRAHSSRHCVVQRRRWELAALVSRAARAVAAAVWKAAWAEAAPAPASAAVLDSLQARERRGRRQSPIRTAAATTAAATSIRSCGRAKQVCLALCNTRSRWWSGGGTVAIGRSVALARLAGVARASAHCHNELVDVGNCGERRFTGQRDELVTLFVEAMDEHCAVIWRLLAVLRADLRRQCFCEVVNRPARCGCSSITISSNVPSSSASCKFD